MGQRWKVSVLSLYLLSLLLGGCQPQFTSIPATSQSPRLSDLQQRGTLIVGTAITRPFEYRDPTTNALIGFDVDLLTESFAPLGIALDWHEFAFADLLPQLQAGALDVVIAAMYITPAREELVDFSQPYLNTGLVLVVRADETRIQTITDLEGRLLGVKESSTGERRAERLRQEGGIALQLRRYTDTLDSLDDLRLGLVDAVFNDYLNTLQYITTHSDVRIQGGILEPAGLGIAVRSGDSDLLAYLNQRLAELQADGSIDRLFQRWINSEIISYATPDRLPAPIASG